MDWTDVSDNDAKSILNTCSCLPTAGMPRYDFAILNLCSRPGKRSLPVCNQICFCRGYVETMVVSPPKKMANWIQYRVSKLVALRTKSKPQNGRFHYKTLRNDSSR